MSQSQQQQTNFYPRAVGHGGYVGETRGPPVDVRAAKPRVRAPVDAEDALQYTPLSSIVPFGGSFVPLPHVQGPSSTTLHPDRRSLHSLESLARKDPNSITVQRSVQEIVDFITSTPKPTYKFKNTLSQVSGQSQDGSQSKVDKVLKSTKMGVVESMVHNQSGTSRRSKYPGPSPIQRNQQLLPAVVPPVYMSTKPTNSQTTPASSFYAAKPSSYPPPPSHATSFYATKPSYQTQPSSLQHVSNLQTSVHHVTPIQHPYVIVPQASPSQPYTNGLNGSAPPSSSSVQYPAILIPPPTADFSPHQYEKHKDVDADILRAKAAALNLKKRKKPAYDDDSETLMSGVDSRAKAEAAVSSLQSLFNAIFEAEDNLQPDTSDRQGIKGSSFWMQASPLGEPHGPILSTSTQMKLESAIQRVIEFGRFGSIHVDDLMRLEKICENSLKYAEDINIRVEENTEMEESFWHGWLERTSIVTNALRTAMTVLRMLVGGRTEKKLYSEDLLQAVLNVARNLFDGALNKLIELRPKSGTVFSGLGSHKKVLNGIMHETALVFQQLSQLLASEEVSEDFITKSEFLSVSIIFIENATFEKDTIFGLQKVERLRVAAMDVLSTLFARYPDQQKFIIDEILSNLEKLPSTRQSARNFKLADGGNIQLTSALIMILLQTSGKYRSERQKRKLPEVNEDMDSPNDVADDQSQAEVKEEPGSVVDKLERLCKGLMNTALQNARYVSTFLINKAMGSTKSGDSPYRNLLDIFVEDFIHVLPLPDWPGAELILRSMTGIMINIVDDPKALTPAKSMALDILGLLGASISDVIVNLRDLQKSYSKENQNAYGQMLHKFTEQCLESHRLDRSKEDEDENRMLTWRGPYKLVLEQLWERQDSLESSKSAYGYFSTLWGSKLVSAFRVYNSEDQLDEAATILEVIKTLYKIIMEKTWYDEVDETDPFLRNPPSHLQLRQAYNLTTMLTPICNSFEHIFTRFMICVGSDQTTTRNKGLKAISQLIEKDSTILDRPQVISFMTTRSEDQSTQVRDSALDMIGKCLLIKPDLERKVYPSIAARTRDQSALIRKRAMRILKDIYLRTTEATARIPIAECLLFRIGDQDETVAELAMKTFEEIWISPFYPMLKDHSDDEQEMDSKAKLIIKDRVKIIVQVAQQNIESVDDTLTNLIKVILDPENKLQAANQRICMWIVRSLFDNLLEHVEENDKIEKQNILKTLTVFARANAKLFKLNQLEMLKPYIENLAAQDDITVYRHVIVIYRCVLPSLSTLSNSFLGDVATALLKNLSKLPIKELKEAVFCLATVNAVLNINHRLAAVTCSCFIGLAEFKPDKTSDLPPNSIKKVSRFLYILGLMGQYCDFDKPATQQDFKKKLGTKGYQWAGSIVQLIADTMLRYTAIETETTIRKSALESLGHVCKTHPEQYLRKNVLEAFDIVFASDNQDLQGIALHAFLAFLQSEERLSEEALARSKAAGTNKETVPSDDFDPGRLTGASTTTSHDGVSTSLGQRYLDNILKLALGSNKEQALSAIELIGSILRQGLVHPNQCTPTLIALEMSMTDEIEKLAERELKTLVTKHETVIERSYMNGVRAAFKYQQSTLGNSNGANAKYHPRLSSLYILIQGNRKSRKKLLAGLIKSLDFDPTQLEKTADTTHATYTRFALHILAFLEYTSLEDILQVTQGLEALVAGTGTTIALQIETEMLQIGSEVPKPVDIAVKKNLCSATVILMMTWSTRSHIRKVYGLGDPRKKTSTKDITKAPARVPGVTSKTLWDELEEIFASMKDENTMDLQCREFLEVLTLDKDFQLAADNEDDEFGPADDLGDDDTVMVDENGIGTASRKRRKIASPPATPSKKKSRKIQSKKQFSRGSTRDSHDDDYD